MFKETRQTNLRMPELLRLLRQVSGKHPKRGKRSWRPRDEVRVACKGSSRRVVCRGHGSRNRVRSCYNQPLLESSEQQHISTSLLQRGMKTHTREFDLWTATRRVTTRTSTLNLIIEVSSGPDLQQWYAARPGTFSLERERTWPLKENVWLPYQGRLSRCGEGFTRRRASPRCSELHNWTIFELLNYSTRKPNRNEFTFGKTLHIREFHDLQSSRRGNQRDPNI